MSGSRAARLAHLRRRVIEDPDLSISLFQAAVASLNRGELTFPAPFDLLASGALAENTRSGEAALRAFDFLRRLAVIEFRVTVEAVVDGPHNTPMTREILHYQGPAAMVAGLLIDVLAELEEEKETHDGSKG